MPEELPDLHKVIITHYQCEDFNQGNAILNLHIYANGKVHEFQGPDEAAFIRNFCSAVIEYQSQGFRVVHWSQNRPYYGPDHIAARYCELTGETSFTFQYKQDINLSEWLKEQYGESYLPPESRLDTLATLNKLQCAGSVDKYCRTYAPNRLLLLKGLYNKARQNSLIVCQDEQVTTPNHRQEVAVPCFEQYIAMPNRSAIGAALKKEFSSEKCKSMRLLIEVLVKMKVINLYQRGNKAFFGAMQNYFKRDIGSYNGIYGYTINEYTDKEDMERLRERVQQVLDSLPE